MIRPQPIDLAPWPLGGLLIPDVEGGAQLAADAVAGRETATASAAEGPLTFWAKAASDDAEGALEALAGVEGPIADYNRFVLAPSAETLEVLRGKLEGELAQLLEVAAFRCGLQGELPETPALDGELESAALASAASSAMERRDAGAAAKHLEAAIEAARSASPGLASQLHVSLVEVERENGASAERVIELLRGAIDALGHDGFDTLRAELHLELGVTIQETSPARLPEAAAMFQDALRALKPETHPRAHGFAQMRLGLCYLSMPMRDAGDALRMGVATQALKSAVKVLDPEREPDLWCAAATNLANAYQMLPSGHLEKNLEQGVELYSRALDVRAAEVDPVGHARVRVNRANALATLERYDEAIEDLRSACPALQAAGAADDHAVALRLLEDLERTRLAAAE